MNLEMYQHLLLQLASRHHSEGEPVFSSKPKDEYYAIHYPTRQGYGNRPPNQNSVFHEYDPTWSMYMEIIGLATVFDLDFELGE